MAYYYMDVKAILMGHRKNLPLEYGHFLNLSDFLETSETLKYFRLFVFAILTIFSVFCGM